MSCPACGSHSSAVLAAFREGLPCPSCELSAAATAEVLAIQRSRADGQLQERLAVEIRRRNTAEVQAERLARQLDAVRRALNDDPDVDW